VRNAAGVSNNLRLIVELDDVNSKIAGVQLYDTMMSEVKKIPRILNSRFPRRR
jgi:hypothetical protein